MPFFNRLARVVLTLMLGVLLVGFGACGAYGTFGGLFSVLGGGFGGRDGFSMIFVVCGALGLAIAFLCWLGLRRLWRRQPPFDQ